MPRRSHPSCLTLYHLWSSFGANCASIKDTFKSKNSSSSLLTFRLTLCLLPLFDLVAITYRLLTSWAVHLYSVLVQELKSIRVGFLNDFTSWVQIVHFSSFYFLGSAKFYRKKVIFWAMPGEGEREGWNFTRHKVLQITNVYDKIC